VVKKHRIAGIDGIESSRYNFQRISTFIKLCKISRVAEIIQSNSNFERNEDRIIRRKLKLIRLLINIGSIDRNNKRRVKVSERSFRKGISHLFGIRYHRPPVPVTNQHQPFPVVRFIGQVPIYLHIGCSSIEYETGGARHLPSVAGPCKYSHAMNKKEGCA